MNPRRQVFLAVMTALLSMSPCAYAEDRPASEALPALLLDINGDGEMDRAVISENSDDGSLDLSLYLSIGTHRPATAQKPSVFAPSFIEGADITLQSLGGALVVSASYNLYGNDWDERLTIAFRDGGFWVTAIQRSWEMASRKSNLDVDVNIGSCSIDLVSGQGDASRDLADPTPLPNRYASVRLQDWSDATMPAPCRF